MTNSLRNLPLPGPVAASLRRRIRRIPPLAVVLGSGFQALADALEAPTTLSYDKLPGFPIPTVPGHPGRLLCGQLEGVPVMVLSGRAHYYEGRSMEEVTFPIRVLAEAGVQAVLLTNAAGGVNPRFRVGDFMRIEDHINFLGANPLRGQSRDGCPTFLDCTEVYDVKLRKLLARAARETRSSLRSGVYLAVSGPSYETPAEIRAFRRWGADAVGMSTVPEALAARAAGLKVAGLSCITNVAAGLGGAPISHREVLETGRRTAAQSVRLITRFAVRFAEASGSPP